MGKTPPSGALPIDFEVPEELKKYGITRIVQAGPFVKILYKGQSITSNWDVAKLISSAIDLSVEAGKIITSNGIDASDIIEKLVSHVVSETTSRYEKDLAEGKITTTVGNGKAQQQRGGQGEKEKPTYTVKKFSGVSTISPNGQGLAEAVIINGEALFACTINSGSSVTFLKELEIDDVILRPPTKQEYPPDSSFEYANEDEFTHYIKLEQEKDSLYNLYRDIKKFYTKEYFVDTDPKNTTLLTLYTITSYFQDKFSTVAYVWLVGDNGSGKYCHHCLRF